MEGTTVLRQNHALKKKNKENVQPAQEVKSFIKRNISKVAAAQLQTNGNKKETLTKTVNVPTVKQGARKPNAAEASGKATTLKTEEAAKLKKPVGEAPPKPTPAAPSSRAALGLYKGKVIESKIGAIWKSSVPARNEEQKPTALNTTNATNQTAGGRGTTAAGRGTTAAGQGTTAVGRGTSAAGRGTTAAGRGITAAGRGMSAAANGSSVRPAVGAFSSARPPVRSVPTAARPRNATVAQSRRCGTLIAKPPVPVTDVKKSRPPVTSTVGQYRGKNETAEEKRAKLAEWLASKGKSLKRPAMVPSGVPAKVRTANKPSAAAPQKSQTQSRPAAEAKQPKPVPPAVAVDNQVKADRRTSLIMNTTLDLLETSDGDLHGDSQDGGGGPVDDIVMNLCDALEALEPPSQCDHEHDESEGKEENEGKEESEWDVKRESPENGTMKSEAPENRTVKSESLENVTVKSEDGVRDEEEVEEECEESEDDCYVDENVPPTEDASVVKYNVKTTPFSQSVKKTIEDEVCSSASKRRSNIKDIKFLTPVRRSSRIHRQASRLPAMLGDHDPCVTSLAELVQLDDDANAYIYRKNPALLEELPDQPRV